MKKLLEINNLKKIYHTMNEEMEALKDISFSILENEFISIVGPSGCGKSTILSIISGLIQKSSGDIKIKDYFKVAYMLQDDCLLPFRTVLDNCLIGLEITNELNEENIKYVKYLLNKYGLRDFINKYPSNLSDGMRQRVALDYQSTLSISDDIYKIIKNEGKAAIMVTHDIELAISMSDKVIVLSNRPSIVKNIYEINYINKKKPTDNRKSTEFIKYFDLIWGDLDVQI